MRFILFICFLAFAINGIAQPFAIGRQTITLTDPTRSNRSIPSEIFYPATSAGNNTPVANGVFPVIVFGHGFSMNYDAYSNFWNELVPQGYMLAFPKTEIGPIPFPSHGDLAADMNYTITWFIAENTMAASRYNQKLNGKFAVMGHSMGGGCSFIAAATNPNITVIANYAAAETNPSAIAAAANITIPALIFAGSKDCVAGPSGNQTPMYNALASICKSYVNITDGSHCQFGESNTLCNFGETTSCPFSSYISRNAQHTKTFQYLNPFLRFYLKGDCSAWPVYQQLLTSPTGATVQNSCSYQLPVAAITVNGSQSICQGDTTLLEANNTYTNLWTGGSTQQQLTVTQGGTYQLIVTDNLGCKDTASQAIVQTAIQVQATIINANCGSNDGEATLNPSGGTAPYSFEWPNGDTNNSLTGLSAGSYAVTVTDASACAAIYTVSISAPGTLSASIATIGTTCPNDSTGSAVATVSGGTAPYSYSWQGVSSASDTAVGFPAGQYQLIVTDSNGCNLIETFDITSPILWSPLIVSLTGTELCEEDTARIVPIDNYYGYLWNTGDTTQTINVTQSGFYNCTVLDGSGCYVPGVGVTVSFFQNYLNPEIELTGDSLYITEGTVVAWFVDGVAISGANDNYIINPADGGYFAQVVDSNGCFYFAKAYTVTGIAQPKLLDGIQVYPNPAKDVITITGVPASAELLLTDIVGKQFPLLSYSNSGNDGTITLKLDQMPAQMYLLQVVSGESRYICKVFITQ
jgi:pimeloyl-ACP methyl ester carboxylesterase